MLRTDDGAQVTEMATLDEKTNPVLKETVKKCEEAARRNDAAVWKRVAEELSGSTRKRREVTVSDVVRNADDGDTVVVPGKVTGSGRVDEDITVAAFDFTRSAMDAIDASGEAMYIDVLVDENPDGEGVIILG